MANSSDTAFKDAWSVTSEIAKACREFNELQFKYRQLAISLILAAYAAIGFLMTQPDPAIKAGAETRAAQKTTTAKPADTVEAAPATKDAGQGTKSNNEPPATPSTPATHADKMSLMVFGIGVLALLAIAFIFALDVRVYHQLLRAMFETGKKFENQPGLAGVLTARIHTAMGGSVAGAHPGWWISGFYWLVIVATLLPWYCYTLLFPVSNLNWWASSSVAQNVVMITCVLSLVIWFVLNFLPGQTTVASSGNAPNTSGAIRQATYLDQQLFDELYAQANAAKLNARAPYSGFHVGASVRATRGPDARIFSGCNIENAAYGSTMCAERNALGAAVAAGYDNITDVMLCTDSNLAIPPCGACLQVLAELAPNAAVHMVPQGRAPSTMALPALLPSPFKSSMLASPRPETGTG